jgi:hypothetical protein
MATLVYHGMNRLMHSICELRPPTNAVAKLGEYKYRDYSYRLLCTTYLFKDVSSSALVAIRPLSSIISSSASIQHDKVVTALISFPSREFCPLFSRAFRDKRIKVSVL